MFLPLFISREFEERLEGEFYQFLSDESGIQAQFPFGLCWQMSFLFYPSFQTVSFLNLIIWQRAAPDMRYNATSSSGLTMCGTSLGWAKLYASV